jgi:hypothetical protein
MALPKTYTQAPSRIPEFFDKIRDGQAPDQFTQQTLKDWGFATSNDRALLPLLKTISFLSPDGKPTTSYHDYRDHSASKAVLGRALKEAYKDIFLIKEFPAEGDRGAIKGKFKSYHNVSDHVAGLMMKTFYALLKIADLKSTTKAHGIKSNDPHVDEQTEKKPKEENTTRMAEKVNMGVAGLHYNIQIHLPATKDIEVYNAIFKSLKEHLFNE